MKNLLVAGFTAALLAAAGPTFANPAEEVAQDYAGWRAAQRAAATDRSGYEPMITAEEIAQANGFVVALPQSRTPHGRRHARH